MILTKEERNNIYTYALEAYIEERKKCGLCWCIYTAIMRLGFDLRVDPYSRMEEYPEIIKHKPLDAGEYWFPKEDKEIRIKILKEAIELTKPKTETI